MSPTKTNNIIILSGIVLIYPVWIEEPLLAHQDIVEVKAVPVPDSFNVNNVCACVVKRPESTLSEDDVKEIVNTILTPGGSDYITIDHVLFFEDELPNVKRLELSQLAAKMLGKC
ncbi:4-coumarate--CoA ligase-like 7 [Biomphalaria pfeifferi]|uniref:4-coumarate--CoA ligase-like 7 n=1 Tax=Biomphalaria pfeifferi TaxID=112525 RepID=A0AAD8F3V2_BIOPF|nr:4-coumarate--CoA ligase-like 7 [Biomphalaria pfeifferi]